MTDTIEAAVGEPASDPGSRRRASSASATAASRSASAPDGRTLRADPRRQGPPGVAGLHVREGAAARPLPERRGERLLHPLRRRPDGTFEEIDWDTAIREVAARLGAVRDAHGGETIFYYGGGGQGNHLGGAYGAGDAARRSARRFRSSAARPGEDRRVLGQRRRCSATPVRGDFEHCEVALFVGKNPWMSHGIPHARTTLKAIANDPDRSMIVIDPAAHRDRRARRLPPPGRARARDAWLLAALAAVLVAGGPASTGRGWPSTPPGSTRSSAALARRSPIAEYCAIAGVDEDAGARAPPGASPRRRASPCSRTSACR